MGVRAGLASTAPEQTPSLQLAVGGRMNPPDGAVVWQSLQAWLAHDELQMLGRVLAAGVLGAVLGWERESRGKAAGFRTHILVALASALFASVSVLVDAGDGRSSADVLRVVPAVATGIGFLGAGIIFVQRDHMKVRGLTTAADVWATSAIGITCGFGFFILAAGTAFLAWISLRVLAWFDIRSRRSRETAGPGRSGG